MRFALLSNVKVDGVTYTHVLCSVAIAPLGDDVAVNVRRVLQRRAGGAWRSGPDAPGIAAIASNDPEADGFLALVEDALAALLAAKAG